MEILPQLASICGFNKIMTMILHITVMAYSKSQAYKLGLPICVPVCFEIF